ncbi:transcriptional regulator [Marinicauda algicola]|uniref:Transcriptional regulator n=1 Tax=Marinicauda algicola TaxID=2029849 RepID=A0A4S2GXJ4_9PROT|nr:metal-sensitive transcriptional regulator [Marinicauda algicola]TGY87618.1 transcriptional regulator [Marinicauda algicola]
MTHRPEGPPRSRATLDRLKRIEGQVRGVSNMVESGRYCIDILTQLAAIKSALAGVEREILSDHARHCLADAAASNDAAEQREKFEELVALLSKHFKL